MCRFTFRPGCWTGCMRGAGLPLPALAEYVRLSQEGDGTIPDRRELLMKQKERLALQIEAIQKTMERLEYKISCYDKVTHCRWSMKGNLNHLTKSPFQHF